MKYILKASFIVLIIISKNLYASERIAKVKNDNFVANYYPSQNKESQYAVLVLGGSEGGIPDKLAIPIAEAGFPVLSLAYFKEANLPDELEKIQLEYFDAAKDWLLKQENVNKDGIILVGWSKGAELALLLASQDERIKRVVAIAPSSVVWSGILKDWKKVPGSSWTKNGNELTHIPFKPSGEVNGLLDLYTQSLENRTDKNKADIPVENIKNPVVLLTGSEDEIWPSGKMADSVCHRMNKNKTDLCQHISYQKLDHLLNYKFLDKSDPMNSDFINLLKHQ